MTLYEFNMINDEDKKLTAVLDIGEYVAGRREADKEISLYQVCSFYVEVSDSYKEGEAFQFLSFSSLEPLKPYLEEIDISRLFQINQ